MLEQVTCRGVSASIEKGIPLCGVYIALLQCAYIYMHIYVHIYTCMCVEYIHIQVYVYIYISMCVIYISVYIYAVP